MGVWVQRDREGRSIPLMARRIALVLLSERNLDGLEPILMAPIPGVDGLIRLPGEVSARQLVTGAATEALGGFDAALWLRPGETPLVGKEFRFLRAAAQHAQQPCLLPVHYPLGPELTLLSLEPRWLIPGVGGEGPHGFLSLPVESAAGPDPEPPAPRDDLAWAVLHRALWEVAAGDRTLGMEILEHLYRQVAGRYPTLAGLVARNGMAAALVAGERRWLETWTAHSGPYVEQGELRLLTALVPYVRGDLPEAAARLTSVLERPATTEAGGAISGGGETSYRALTFRGRALAGLGDLNRAVADWAQALRLCPDYLPPLREIADRRLHADVLNRLELHRFWLGRSPETVMLVARAYARSSHPELAAPILEAKPELPFPKQLRRAVRGARAISRRRTERPGVRWEGPLFTASSLARVNRELAVRLINWKWDLGGVPTEPDSYAPRSERRFWPLADRLWHLPAETGVTVRHHWPPTFAPAPSGRLVVMLPWEYGPVPREWIPGLRSADEVWVYSRWIRDGLITSGIEPERVQVVPCGFDPERFHPPVEPAPERGERFHFLYVGGTIPRKGYDLALQAFLLEFRRDEPVTLTIKDFGSDSFYRAASGAATVRAAASSTAGSPRQVVLVDAVLSDADLAELYRSADVLLAPYRAEGFCLPALEAMACGTPAILPAAGPALDYAEPDTALLVQADLLPIGTRFSGMELAGEGQICQIPLEELRRAMRWAYDHRQELRAMGGRAADRVHTRFTWDQAARTAERRLSALLS